MKGLHTLRSILGTSLIIKRGNHVLLEGRELFPVAVEQESPPSQIMHENFSYYRLVDTFEKKSREVSVEPSTNEQGYPQAQKLSEAAARGLEGSGEEDEGEEGEETAEDRERGHHQQETLSSDDDDIV